MMTQTTIGTIYGIWGTDFPGATPDLALYVRLVSGQTIGDLHFDDQCRGFMSGWLSGSLYCSYDFGQTWAPSTLRFSCA